MNIRLLSFVLIWVVLIDEKEKFKVLSFVERIPYCWKLKLVKKKWLSTINRDRKIFILYSIIRQYGVIQIILIDYTRIVQKRKKMSVAQNMSAVELFVNKESFFTYLKEICVFQNWNMLKQTNFDTFWWLK